jgi:Holliday junction resolvase RusA-like endonuclease
MMDALTPIADVVLDLPLCPSTNNLFATGATGRRFKSAEYTGWIEEAGWRLNAQRARPIAGKVALLIEVEEPKTKIRQDCTNRIKAVEDLLVTHGIIEGDDQRYVRQVTVRWTNVTGVRVTIRSCE